MAKGKRTINIDKVIDIANKNLGLSELTEHINTEFKMGICAMIEQILLDSGRYNGFYHLDKDDCEFGTFGYYSRKYFK